MSDTPQASAASLADIDLESPTAEDLRLIDAAVAEHVLGKEVRDLECSTPGSVHSYPLPRYSADPALVFEVVDAMRTNIFSKRNRFMIALRAEVCFYVGASLAWPDVLFYIKPQHVCIAALRALEVLP